MSEEQLTPQQMIDNAIAEALDGPRRASGDAGEVESHNLKDLIAMKQFLAGRTSATKSNRGLRFSKFIPDGSTGVGSRSSWPWR